MRRFRGHMSGEQYLGNTATKEVHDLDQEERSTGGCQIDDIITAGHDTPFDTLGRAQREGYRKCTKCLAEPRR